MCVCNTKVLLGSVGEPRGSNFTETRRAEKKQPGSYAETFGDRRTSSKVHSRQVRHPAVGGRAVLTLWGFSGGAALVWD